MYGLPKLIELDRIKSPGCTCRVLLRPSGFIFSEVLLIYRPSEGASPILTQFKPLVSSVMYSSIGRGEPPRSITTSSPNLRCSQAGVPLSCQLSSSKAKGSPAHMRKRALQISGSRSTILLDGVLRHLDAVAELDVAGGGHAGRQAVDVDEAIGGLLVEAVAGVVGGEVVVVQ